MGKLQDFLMENDLPEAVTAEVEIKPFPFKFQVKSITEAENKSLKKSCQRQEFDRKTRTQISVIDADLYTAKLVVSCVTEPNFKDAELQEKCGVVGAEALVNRLLSPGQFAALVGAVQEVNRFGSESAVELVEQAKN